MTYRPRYMPARYMEGAPEIVRENVLDLFKVIPAAPLDFDVVLRANLPPGVAAPCFAHYQSPGLDFGRYGTRGQHFFLSGPELRAYRVMQAHVERLETRIDVYAAQCRPIEYFILPGGSRLSAMLHVCRTAARRTERRVIALERAAEQMNPVVKIYLNRLSDLLFVLARAANAREGAADVCYVRSKKAFR